jgi:hypothetical protein
MTSGHYRQRRAFTGLVAAFLAGVATTAGAATINFSSADDTGVSTYGNSLAFSSDGIGVTARAFAETGAATGSGYYRFQTAEVFSWSTGLGICNRTEGTANVTCDNNGHEIDTGGRDDLLVLVFDQVVNFSSLTVLPFDGAGSDPNDRDVIYRVGNLAALPDLAGYSFDTLGGIAGVGAEVLSAASSGYDPFTHALSGSGNVLFVSGNYHDRGCTAADVDDDGECEAYKVVDVVVSAVPVPAVAWLLVPAFGIVGLRRRRPA